MRRTWGPDSPSVNIARKRTTIKAITRKTTELNKANALRAAMLKRHETNKARKP